MTSLNHNLFIDSTATNGKIGYVLIKLFDGIDKDTLQLSQGYTGIDDDIVKFDNGDDTKIGFEQKIVFSNLKYEKKSKLIPIAGQFIGELIQIQKYLITRYILNDIFALLKNRVASKTKLETVLGELDTNIKKYIKTNADDYGLLLIIIAQIVDRILNVNLDNIVSICATNIIQTTTLPDDYNLINITQYNKADIAELNLDNIEKDIYALFKKDRKLNMYHYFDDILEKQEKIKIYIK